MRAERWCRTSAMHLLVQLNGGAGILWERGEGGGRVGEQGQRLGGTGDDDANLLELQYQRRQIRDKFGL